MEQQETIPERDHARGEINILDLQTLASAGPVGRVLLLHQHVLVEIVMISNVP